MLINYSFRRFGTGNAQVFSTSQLGTPGQNGFVQESRGVKASPGWLAATGAEFSAGTGLSGCAHLTHYTVEYREWGDGPPIVLIPGMAGGFELLGPLARLLSRSLR